MASRQYVMTVMAANRVGILAALATALDELGGGFVDLSLAIMRDHFTIIMAVEFPENRHPDVIVDHLRAVGRPFGLEVMLKDPAADPPEEPLAPAEEAQDFLLRVQGQDKPGVLRRITLRLAQEGIDIVDLYGERNDATGTFETCLALRAPLGVASPRLQADLEHLLRAAGARVAVVRNDVLQAISDPHPLIGPTRPPAGSSR
jgi:glycine cleavage system transcriptional repressor